MHHRRRRVVGIVRLQQRLTSRPYSDDGAAVVEFVLVGSLVVFLFLGVLQIGLLLHMRNVIVSSASEAVHTAARADGSCRDGVERFEQLVGEALSSSVTDGVRRPVLCGPDPDAAGVVRLQVHVELPLVFLPFGSVAVSSTAHAVQEGA